MLFRKGQTIVLGRLGWFGASLVAQMVKNLPAMQDTQVWSLGQKYSLEKGMATHPVFLPGEFHGQRSLVGSSPWGHKESPLSPGHFASKEALHLRVTW